MEDISIDNNICFHPNSTAAEWVDTMGTLANWQLNSSFDNNSSESAPGFTDPINNDFSPIAMSSSMVDAGHATLSSANDILGTTRDTMPDIGAYEWANSTVEIFNNGFE